MDNTLKIDLQSWYESVNKSINSWQANYIYLDEIKELPKIERKDWIVKSIEIFNIMIEKFNFNHSHLPCLCIKLKMKRKNVDIENISLKWLQKNLNEFTPPLFFYSSLEHYKDYYVKLEECIIDGESLFEIKNCKMFYSSQFDNIENGFIRTIYIFNNG